MKKVIYLGFVIIFHAYILANSLGCSSTKTISDIDPDNLSPVSKRIIPSVKTDLKKRVLLLSFMNQSEIGEDKTLKMTGDFLQLLKEDESIIISTFMDQIPTTIKKNSSQYGVVVDPAIVKKAEDINMDILIMPTLNPIEVSLEKKGIWPFRKLKREIEIYISITVLDVTNGTLLLTNMEKRKKSLKGDIMEKDIGNGKLNGDVVAEASFPILEDHASAIHKVLKARPWTGKIVLIDKAGIRINGGEEIGITQGLIFEVFGKGESIKSLNGNEYYSRGPKLGEIEIHKVGRGYAIGTPISAKRFEVGQIIRLKE